MNVLKGEIAVIGVVAVSTQMVLMSVLVKERSNVHKVRYRTMFYQSFHKISHLKHLVNPRFCNQKRSQKHFPTQLCSAGYCICNLVCIT
jgi:hypothetical protein